MELASNHMASRIGEYSFEWDILDREMAKSEFEIISFKNKIFE